MTDRTVFRPGVSRGLAELGQAVREERRRQAALQEDTGEWPAPPKRRGQWDDRMQRTTVSPVVDDGREYDEGYEDGRREWRRIAVGGIVLSAVCLLITAVVLVRWWEAVS